MNTRRPHPAPLPSRRLTALTTLLLGARLPSCEDPSALNPSSPSAALDPAMSIDRYAAAIEALSSDEFEGRAPSSPGEELTVAYLVEQFEAAGVGPGNGDSFSRTSRSWR